MFKKNLDGKIMSIYAFLMLVFYLFLDKTTALINIENIYFYILIFLFISTIFLMFIFYKKIIYSENKLTTKENEILNNKNRIIRNNKKILKDIELIKKENNSLNLEKEYFTNVFDSINDLILITDIDNKIIYSNSVFKKLSENYSDDLKKSNFRFDYEKHIENNNRIFSSNLEEIELFIDNFFYKKKLIQLQNNNYLLTVGEDRTKLYNTSANLAKTIDNLNYANEEVNIINEKINSLMNFIIEIEDFSNINVEDLLIKIFNYIYKTFDKIDYGSTYIFDNDEVKYLDAKGHNINKLKKIVINKNDFFISSSIDPAIIKNIVDTAAEYFFDEISEATMPIKESLKFTILNGNEIYGAITLDIKKGSDLSFNSDDMQLVNLFSKLISIIVTFFLNIEKSKKLTTDILFSFVNIMKIHSLELYKHSINVGRVSKEFALFCELNSFEVMEAYWSGLMHDMGFLLLKKDVLVKETLFEKVDRKHVEIAYNIMKDVKGLENVANNIHQHHEQYDGTGFPLGLSTDEISFVAQILSIANYYDDLINIEKISFDEFFIKIENERNKSFDSKLIDKFIEWVRKYEISL